MLTSKNNLIVMDKKNYNVLDRENENYEIENIIVFKKDFLNSKMYSESVEFREKSVLQKKYVISILDYIKLFLKYCFE